MADLRMIRGETKQSFVRRRSTEPFSLVFGDGCLLLPSLHYGDDLVCGSISSNDCQK